MYKWIAARKLFGSARGGRQADQRLICWAMPSRIVQRILSETGDSRLFSILAEDLRLSDLQSLLIEVYQARSAALAEKDLLERASRELMAPSKVDARLDRKSVV